MSTEPALLTDAAVPAPRPTNLFAGLARDWAVLFGAAVILVMVVIGVALGVEAFSDRRTVAIILAGISALGLWCSVGGALWSQRSQAGEFATALRARARPGDVVGFCPDQLGPSTARLLAGGPPLQTLTYPRGTPAGSVDWVDYGDAVAAASPSAFAAELVARAGAGHDVWLVAGRGYRPFKGACTTVVDALTALRPSASVAVHVRPIHYFAWSGAGRDGCASGVARRARHRAPGGDRRA